MRRKYSRFPFLSLMYFLQREGREGVPKRLCNINCNINCLHASYKFSPFLNSHGLGIRPKKEKKIQSHVHHLFFINLFRQGSGGRGRMTFPRVKGGAIRETKKSSRNKIMHEPGCQERYRIVIPIQMLCDGSQMHYATLVVG